jgi:hypothetical protein
VLSANEGQASPISEDVSLARRAGGESETADANDICGFTDGADGVTRTNASGALVGIVLVAGRLGVESWLSCCVKLSTSSSNV